jgi:CMP-N,N'-diacetyllegionaminic acid synthase
MYKNKKIACIIPARGGSKGVPRKNVIILNGKPLIAHAIIAAKNSKYVDRVIVSTDDKEIARVAKKYKAEVPFIRPANLATDTATTLPVLQHAIDYLEKNESYKPYLYVLIQPTSPFVLSEDVNRAIEQLFEAKVNSCVSVCEVSERPEWMHSFKRNRIYPFFQSKKGTPGKTARQGLEKLYRLNGAVYVTKRDTLMKKNKIIDDKASAIIMPRSRSHDIDEPIDFHIAEALFKLKK